MEAATTRSPAISTGTASGISTWQNRRHGSTPRAFAASTTSSGRERKASATWVTSTDIPYRVRTITMFSGERTGTPRMTGITTSIGREGTAYRREKAPSRSPPKRRVATANRASGTDSTAAATMAPSESRVWIKK